MPPELMLLLLAGSGILAFSTLSDGSSDADDGPDDNGGDDVLTVFGSDAAETLQLLADDLANVEEPVTVILRGGEGDDTIYGAIGNTPFNRPDIGRFEIHGDGGDDLIWSRDEGDETLADGGTGNDTVNGWAQSWSPETLRGGDGDDVLRSGGDTLEGGAGDDLLIAGVIDPDYHTPDPIEDDGTPPSGTVFDPNMDDTPTVVTGGSGSDEFTLTDGYWRHELDSGVGADRPDAQMNDVVITDFDPASDRLTLPERVGAFHSRVSMDPQPGDILNVTADFAGIEATPTEDGNGTVLTVTYVPAQEAGAEPLTVRITLEGVASFDPGAIEFHTRSDIDYDTVLQRAGLS